MTTYLSSDHFPAASPQQAETLDNKLSNLLANDLNGDFYSLLGGYQRILADNQQRAQWATVHDKLQTLFMCGKAVALDGPMIGIPVSIRDSDYFKETIRFFDRERSEIASIEWMATAWNMTFADTGLWMGKTFERVARETVAKKCSGDPQVMAAYNQETSRIGRNYFRQPANPNLIQGLGLPTLTSLWHLQDRPQATTAANFDGLLTAENLEKEQYIPYSKTGGIFLADHGISVVPEMNGKKVYQLNYRWPALNPVYPMTRLIDEIVQIDDNIYLGQLVFATRHYSLGSLRLPFCPNLPALPFGEPYAPAHKKHFLDFLRRIFKRKADTTPGGVDYGYQNNGYFLMMDPSHARQIYSDGAFPQLRPRNGEQGFNELAYDKVAPGPTASSAPTEQGEGITDWLNGWQQDDVLRRKFTTLILEPSPKESDQDDVQAMLRKDESILQMLQRISREISAQSNPDDRLRHFEKLNRLFRCGVAPTIENGLFKGHGQPGYNTQATGSEKQSWYGKEEPCTGFDYYHGATLNLHLGFADTFCPDQKQSFDQSQLFPSALASILEKTPGGPNVLNMTWHNLGKYIFPWAGKSFERVSGRKLSMLLDESDNLSERYPERVHELQTHLASLPHYDLVRKNRQHHWQKEGPYGRHLLSGAWDQSMSEVDKEFWEKEAAGQWIFGNNIQDERIVAADPLMRIIDMNYRVPDPALQAISAAGPSPFARQGYIFLGTSDRDSILPMNNGENTTKKVFQFHYRYPLIGGPTPIGFCLDELVEIADGLFLGQLIYSTALHLPFHSSVDPAQYKYQLFGYFLLLDDAWQYHRQAIKLDTWHR